MGTALSSAIIVALTATASPQGQAPWAASAAGYVSMQMSDTFQGNTIDLLRTGAAGFNWYLPGGYPNAVQNVWASFTNITSADVSVSNGIFTIKDGRSGFGADVSTCWPNGGSYVGTQFTNGFYAEATIAFNPALASSGYGQWPAFWLLSSNFLISGANTGVEMDVMECLVASGSCTTNTVTGTLHDWSWASPQSPTSNVVLYGTAQPASGIYHRYGVQWIPQAKNGGVNGSWKLSKDGVAYGTVTYSSTAGSAPPAGPSNPSGVFSDADSLSFCMFLGAGPAPANTFPMSIINVQVWH